MTRQHFVTASLLAAACLRLADLGATEQPTAEESFRRAAIAYFSQAQRPASPQPGSLRDLLAALPPAAQLPTLRTAFVARPLDLPAAPDQANLVDAELLFFVLDSLIEPDGRSISDYQALRGRCEKLLGPKAGRDFKMTMFETHIGGFGIGRTAPAAELERFEKALEQGRAAAARPDPARFSAPYARVPDLVSLIGPEKAEAVARQALALKVEWIAPESGPTHALFQRLAVELMNELPLAQWYLARAATVPELFEGMRRRFGDGTRQTANGAFWAAHRKWVELCAQAGRFDELRAELARQPAEPGFQQFDHNKDLAGPLFSSRLLHPRADLALRRRHFEFLLELVRGGRSGEAAWRSLSFVASTVEREDELIAFARTEVARKDAPALHREPALATWAQFAEALGRPDEVRAARAQSREKKKPQRTWPYADPNSPGAKLEALAKKDAWPELLVLARELKVWPAPGAEVIAQDESTRLTVHPNLLVARALWKTGQAGEARLLCTHYLLRQPDEPAAANLLIEMRSEAADLILRGLHARFRSHAGPPLWLALRAVEKGELDQAAKYVAESLAADPSGRSFYWLIDRARRPVAKVLAATGQAAAAQATERLAQGYEDYRTENGLTRAEEEQSLRNRPGTEMKLALAHLLLSTNRVDEADQILRSAFRQLPSEVAFCEPENVAPFDLRTSDRYEKEIARAVFAEMARQQPPSAGLSYLRSRVENAPEEIERLLLEAVRLEPRYVQAWRSLASSADPAVRAEARQVLAEHPAGGGNHLEWNPTLRAPREVWLEAVSRSAFLRQVGVEATPADGRDLSVADALLKLNFVRDFEKILIAAGPLRAPAR